MDQFYGWGLSIVCIILLVGYGVYNFLSSDPVAFSRSEKSLRSCDLKDVKAWNRKHGMLWIIYAVAIFLGTLAEDLMGDNPFGPFVFMIFVIAPIPGMMSLHNKYVREYKKN